MAATATNALGQKDRTMTSKESKQDKINALHTAIDAVKALGEGYLKMVDTLEDDLYSLQQEVLAEEKQETKREEHLHMLDCFTACEEAKQNEKMLKMELKTMRAKLTRMQNSGVWGGADYDNVQGEIVKLTMQLQQVWAKYDRLVYGQ